MTFKEKYNSIDQSKLPENAKSYMADFKKDSDNFTNKQAMALMMPVLDRFIKGLKDSGYGDAIKGGAKKETKKAETPKEMAKEIVEEAVEQPETKTGKPKVGKISKGDFMKIAKEIRKEGESWNSAMKRAGEIIRTQKEVVKKEATRQYEKLKKFIEKHPEVYPMDIPVQGGGFRRTTVSKDAPRVALPKGKRVSRKGWKNQYGKSDGGNKYYEYRSNRYDTRRKRYPFLEKGGEVDAIFAGGGDIPENKSLKYFILNEASSGSIANKTPYTDYKDIEGVRKTAVDILKRYGDVEYTLKSFNDLIEKAAKDYLPEEISKELVDLGESRYVHTSLDTENDKILVVSSQYFADKIHLRTGVDSYGRKLTPQIRKRLTAQMKANIGGSYPIKYREAIENFFEVWFKKYKKYANGGELDGNLVVINYGGDRYDGGVVWAIEENGVQIANGIIDGDWGVDFRGKHYDGLLSLAKGINAKLVNKFDSDDYAKGGEVDAIFDDGGEIDYSEYHFRKGDELHLRGAGIKYFKEWDGEKIIVVDKRSDVYSNKGSFIYPDRIKKVVEYNEDDEYAKGGELDINKYAGAGMFARGGYMSKGELVWNKLSTAKRHDFLHEHFHPEMTPRSIEILVNKSYNFLPKKVKIKMESVYANVEEYAGGGKTNEKLDLLENELTAAGIYVQRLLDMEKVPYLTIFAKSDPILESNFFFINKSGKYEMGNHYWDGDSEKAHVFDNIESIMKYVRSENFKTIADKHMEGKYAKGGEITPKVNAEIVKRAEVIYAENNGSTKEDFDMAYTQAIREAGYNVEEFISTMKHIGAEYGHEGEDFYAKGGIYSSDDRWVVTFQNQDSGELERVTVRANNKNSAIQIAEDESGLSSDWQYYSAEKEMAKGGYTAKGEGYEYVNTFKRFDSDVPVPQEDFEKLVDAYHKQLSGDVLDIAKYDVLKYQMGNYLGHKTVEEIEQYIEKTHNAHEHGGKYANGGKLQNRYKVYIYGDSGRPTVKYANTIEEAKELSFQGEHAEIIDTTTNQMVDPFEFAKGGKISDVKWSNDENKKLGTWLLTSVDGNNILRMSPDGKELEKNVMKYYRKKGSVAKMTYDEDADEGLSWVTFNDLYQEIQSVYAKGGSISKSTTYVPNRDVKELMVVLKGELTKLKGKDILDGVYVKNNRKPAGNKNAAKELLAWFKKEAKNDPYGREVGVDESDIEKLLGAGLSEQDVKNILLGYSPSSVKADTEFGSTIDGLITYTGEYQKENIDEIVSNVKNGYYEIGLKYPRGFDWKAIVNKYKISKTPKIIEIKKPQREVKCEIYLGDGVVVGHQYTYKWKGDRKWSEAEVYGELDSNNPKFENGYWGIVTKKKEDMYFIVDTLLKQSKGYVKDIALFNNNLGGIGSDEVANEKFRKGGKIGFKGLSEKVAKYYANKSVPSKYQTLYGKKYDKAEAKEVGDKVAAKVYRQQQSKKK